RAREADGKLEDDVLPLPREERVRDLLDVRDQVPGRTAPDAGVAHAAQGDVVSLHRAGRNADRHLLLLAHASFPFALGTGRLHDRALAMTAIARRHADHLAEEGALHRSDLAGAGADRTGLALAPGLGARAAALRAGDHAADLDDLLGAARDLLERERKANLQ